MGHYCKICGRTRANEKFSGKGYRKHICKDCSGKPIIQPVKQIRTKQNYLGLVIDSKQSQIPILEEDDYNDWYIQVEGSAGNDDEELPF
ncbi:MAG: hypothetical protein GX434_15110 [Peptococcaceae bacterium]|nr:hypothetical protein [Peptococcaceae bacterium]